MMFSTRWCPYCKKARQLFAKNQVAYCEYDVDSSPQVQDVFTELGGSGVPLILIADEVYYGFSEVGIASALKRNGLLN
ncbi:MAG: glutaredoxin family protein [Thioalkalispiraceae bacterium]